MNRKPKLRLKWTLGNSKLKKTSKKTKYKVAGWGIPADHDFLHNEEKMNTCPSALACKAVCYAKQGMYVMNNVKKARKKNLTDSLKSSFRANLIKDVGILVKKGYNTIRIHDSGDFYRQEYLEDWYAAAKEYPDVIFYSYTKQIKLDLWTNKPDNFRIVQSVGGKHDKLIDIKLPHARIFSSKKAAKDAGYVDGGNTDKKAIEGEVNLALIYHGTKNLTEAQKNYFK